ncbi:MAG: tetratricopeptide repeat protein [Pseudomonadota bacterium]
MGAAYVVGGLPAPAAAQRIGMSGETALAMAAHMIEKGQLDAAEDVLKTLSGGNPETLDMRVVDKLAAKIAYKRGDADRAITLLEGLLTYDEGDVKTRFDLAQVLLAEEKDRAARKHFVAILKTKPNLPAVFDNLKILPNNAFILIRRIGF